MSDIKTKLEELGSLWVKISKKDNKTKFFSGVVKIGGVETRVNIFKNGYKEAGSNQPDWRIYKSNYEPGEKTTPIPKVAVAAPKKVVIKKAPAPEPEPDQEQEQETDGADLI